MTWRIFVLKLFLRPSIRKVRRLIVPHKGGKFIRRLDMMSITIETIQNVSKNRKAVQDFLTMDEGSNAYIEQESALRAVGIKLGRQELAELESVFENQDAVQRFLDLRYGSIQSEEQAAILHDLGINPDKQYLTNVMAALHAKLDIVGKAERYVTLNKLEGSGAKLSSEATNEIASLRRELNARGLDPQHIDELEYRALVYKHKSKVATFVDMRDGSKRHAQVKYELKGLGIDPNKKRLARILAGFKLSGKQTSKKKTTRGVNMARKQADLNLADIRAEISAEDTRITTAASAIGLSFEEFKELAAYCGITLLEFVSGVEEFIAAENAKKQREAMAAGAV